MHASAKSAKGGSSGRRRAAKRGRSRRAGTGIRNRVWAIVLASTGVVAAVVVTGVFVAAPLGDAIGQTVNSVLTAEGARSAQDDQQTVVVPTQSIVVSQPGDTPGALAGVAGQADVAWATSVAAETNISLRAIQAYTGVAVAKQIENPDCHVGWNTLAAIGAVESGSGTHAGSSVGADGVVSPPIYGPSLSGHGNGFATVADSDGGAIDGDASADRAVGPMQLIPQAWRNWGTDANGDGVADPQNIDDAVLATANYLCHAGGDLSTTAGWRRGVAAYNDATSYALKVSLAANRFAAAAASA